MTSKHTDPDYSDEISLRNPLSPRFIALDKLQDLLKTTSAPADIFEMSGDRMKLETVFRTLEKRLNAGKDEVEKTEKVQRPDEKVTVRQRVV